MSIASHFKFRQSPQGLNNFGAPRSAQVEILHDLTYQQDGQQICEQTIFDAIEEVIQQAQDFIVLDLFLYNDDYAKHLTYPKLAGRVTDAVLKKRQENLNLPILLITDPMNTFYGARTRNFFEELRAANIEVVETNLDALRDSNPTYSFFYRALFAGKTYKTNLKVPNVLDPDGEAVPVSSYAKLLNFKANHRKIALNEKTAVVSSANPHDASSPNHNFGFRVEGEIVADLLASEKAVYDFSAGDGDFFKHLAAAEPEPGESTARLLTEEGIRHGALELIAGAEKSHYLQMGMFYLSDRAVIEALKEAASRGVTVQVILDKNIDAFGRKKTGLPNLPVSQELAQAGVQVRWAATNGEQYHPKYLALVADNQTDIIAGSGNFTRRNIGDFNLETSLWVNTRNKHLREQFAMYWNRQWKNIDAVFTQSLDSYKKPKPWHRLIYLAQEKSGFSTF